MNIPTLDLSRLATDHDAFLRDLREAAHGVGFFYLSGHRISAKHTNAVLKSARDFFALPEADKLAIEMVKSLHFRGYNRTGTELTRGQPDWREQIDIGAELSPLPQSAVTPPWDRLQGPNQWPAELPDFKWVILSYQDQVTELAIQVLRAFCEALGLSPDALKAIYNPFPTQLLKVIRYPGVEKPPGQGVGPHKDFGFITILLQDGVNNGLQVKGEGDTWIDAPPIPGTFVVNIGENLEMATDGYLRANIHRAVSPPVGSDRISVPFFLEGRFNATVPTLRLPPELAAEARGVEHDPINPLYRQVGRNYLKGRLRSHPDVAQRHHGDLL